jgi:hypothetical protein
MASSAGRESPWAPADCRLRSSAALLEALKNLDGLALGHLQRLEVRLVALLEITALLAALHPPVPQTILTLEGRLDAPGYRARIVCRGNDTRLRSRGVLSVTGACGGGLEGRRRRYATCCEQEPRAEADPT